MKTRILLVVSLIVLTFGMPTAVCAQSDACGKYRQFKKFVEHHEKILMDWNFVPALLTSLHEGSTTYFLADDATVNKMLNSMQYKNLAGKRAFVSRSEIEKAMEASGYQRQGWLTRNGQYVEAWTVPDGWQNPCNRRGGGGQAVAFVTITIVIFWKQMLVILRWLFSRRKFAQQAF